MDANAYTRRMRDLQRTQRSSSDPETRKAAGRQAEQLREQWQRRQARRQR